MKKDLPRNTIVRLSRYRRLLEKYRYLEEPFIFSHDLARMLDLKPVNVRHDLMLLGISGNRNRGYNVNALLEKIAEKLDVSGQQVILIGLGRLGNAILDHIGSSHAGLEVAAAFDIDPSKHRQTIEGTPCFSILDLSAYIKKSGITTAILSIPSNDVNDILPIMLDAGIKGILNYSAEQLNVPADVIVRNVDVISLLEEIKYFTSDEPD